VKLHFIKNVTTALVLVIQKYQFDYKLGSLIADNASNNNEFYDYFLQSLSVAKNKQLWCVGHIINLIIKALIYSKGISKLKYLMISMSEHVKFNFMWQRGFIGKVYNIVKYIM
jgi:hypothetical protein